MRQFTPKPGTKSATKILEIPFRDITSFNSVVCSLILANPLGCTSYMSKKKNHPPIHKAREMYTAKFVYLDADGKQVGRGQDTYDSVEGFDAGIAAVISNLANREAHRGKVKRIPSADLFSVLLRCHDPDDGLYFLSIARDRITIASYTDDRIRDQVEKWATGVPELA
ncbi:MAG: hypothetical protein LUQ71_08350 [Methanoregula sp.]|nr:hypothetical protein [Methanoregula sp.]